MCLVVSVRNGWYQPLADFQDSHNSYRLPPSISHSAVHHCPFLHCTVLKRITLFCCEAVKLCVSAWSLQWEGDRPPLCCTVLVIVVGSGIPPGNVVLQRLGEEPLLEMERDSNCSYRVHCLLVTVNCTVTLKSLSYCFFLSQSTLYSIIYSVQCKVSMVQFTVKN